MIPFKDKVFCASPNSQNNCGHKMGKELEADLKMKIDAGYIFSVSYDYFCGAPEEGEKRMVDCKECSDYVNNIFNRGEITKDEIDKVIIDRHALKGCDKKTDPFINWLDFSIENQVELAKENKAVPEWNKGYLEALDNAKYMYLNATLTNEGAK